MELDHFIIILYTNLSILKMYFILNIYMSIFLIFFIIIYLMLFVNYVKFSYNLELDCYSREPLLGVLSKPFNIKTNKNISFFMWIGVEEIVLRRLILR